MTKYLALILVFACGSMPEPVADSPAVLKGEYNAGFRTVSTKGACDWLTSPDGGFGGHMSFDERGQPQSPFPGVDCTATYDTTAHVTMTCQGYGNKLKAVSSYSAFQDDTVYQTDGPGTADGNVGGCTHVTFHWYLWKKKPHD